MHTPRAAATEAAVAKMEARGAHPAELAAFGRRLDQLTGDARILLPGDELEPVEDLPRLDDLPEPDADRARDVLDRLAVIKVNGGLGTSMGLDGPKSLLEVKPGRSFLDVLALQTTAMRRRFDARLPLVLMNSASTRGPSLAALGAYDGLATEGLPPDFLQGWEPKLRADDHQPVTWDVAPELEWCPSGHGDLYASLAATGMREMLLAEGVRWCFVSNADNLGAGPDVRIASWLAEADVPFCLEVVRGTAMDRKGGHLARRDSQIVLRESAQVPPGDHSFGDVARWRYFNTNNLWLDLEMLRKLQDDDPAAPELPLIVNRKTVDPSDPSSTPVLQLETAMGAAISSIEGARAIEVPRHRFAPVKTTDDLLVSRSDLYELSDSGEMLPRTSTPPRIALDREHFTLVRDFEARFPAGPPSLRHCESLEVNGDVTFGARVTIDGAVRIAGPRHVADDEVVTGSP